MRNIFHAPSRRELLLASGVLFAWAHMPRAARAEGRDPRFLTIVLRGALDGLATVAPVGDPDWVRLRGDDALTLDGAARALPLDNFFALNPAMPNLARMAATVHSPGFLSLVRGAAHASGAVTSASVTRARSPPLSRNRLASRSTSAAGGSSATKCLTSLVAICVAVAG